MEQTFKNQLKQMLAENEKRFNETAELEKQTDKEKEKITTRLNKLKVEEEELCIIISEMQAELNKTRTERAEKEQKMNQIDRKLKNKKEEDRKERAKMIRKAADINIEGKEIESIYLTLVEERTREF